jgi:two-component system LytT family sensor kinase
MEATSVSHLDLSQKWGLAPLSRRVATYGVIALLVCAALALRSASGSVVGRRLDPVFIVSGVDSMLWWAVYYPMWAALTPLIFFLGRRVPFRRGRRLLAAGFHASASVVVAASAPLALSILFGVAVLGFDWPDVHDLLTPVWLRLAGYHAISDSLMYWLILAAGMALRVYDDYQAKRLQAADLERSLVAAQVEALKMKLQPHFLFNTLNSIGFLAIEKDTGAIETMVGRLGNLLRASIAPSQRQLVPLELEVALLDQYLAIEEVRFKDRLRVVRRIDAAAGRALVPSLVLQPIVENSIKHGFSRRIDASLLDLTIRREGDRLLVVVRDDGPGLPPGWDLATHCGRGLRNVVERLEALYRGQWSLTLRNNDPQGTVAELRIPWTEDVGGG